jgi:hypothetical protein
MTTLIAFYKVQKGDVWGNLIAGWTGLFNPKAPKYCHVEIKVGTHWFSSASRNPDGTTGTRWIDEKDLLKNRERWDVYEVQTPCSLEAMEGVCKAEVGKAYDWLGIAGFATLFGALNSKNMWYCSEICNYIWSGVWKRRISPIGLYVKVKPRIVRCLDA